MSWHEFGELAAREKRLVEAGSWEELLDLQDERDRLIASLTTPAPPEARALLVEAREQSLVTEEALGRAVADTEQQLGTLRLGRKVVVAYGGAAQSGLDARA